MQRRKVLAVLFLVVSLAIGYFVSQQLSGFLGIAINPKTLPNVPVPDVRLPAETTSPVAPITTIVLPVGSMADARYQRAATELATAVSYRTGIEPLVLEATESLPAGRKIEVDNRLPSGTGEPGSFSLSELEPESTLVVGAGDDLSAVYGMYFLAAQLKSGADVDNQEALVLSREPAMEYRLVDMGGVGVRPDEEAWQAHDYSHHLRAFDEVILAESPYIDEQAMAQAYGDFQEYVHRMIAFGYNGIIFDGFLEYVDFDKVGDGQEIYEAGSEYRQRHAALRDAFGKMLTYADDMGMKVIFKTDMLVFSEPLAEYFQEFLGGVNVNDPELWAIYRLGLAELFERFPFADGLMIRIGEAGSIYNLEGWDYFSSLDVRTDESVQLMLKEFTDVAADYDKTIFFRSWSVGIGEVGNMHTDPETYERVLGDLDIPNLVISTKYTMGDYYSYLPLNPTLEIGDQRRIVEFQARREFEAFNAFPNYMGPEHQVALRTFMEANPNIEGVWVWTQGGGPQRAGPWSIYPFHGFWQTYDDNIYATGQLAWDPGTDIQDLTEAWIRMTLSYDPETVSDLAQMAYLSREATLKGLYIGGFGSKQILAMGLEPPPQFWIFEWDIVSGSTAALSAVYKPVSEKVEIAVKEGFDAVAVAREMRALVEGSDPATYYQPELREKMIESLAYEENLFETLAWYRKAFLNYYHWLDSGDVEAFRQWQEAYPYFVEMKESHLGQYSENFDFPAYNFFAAEAGMAHAVRSDLMMWLARILAVLILLTLLAGTSLVQRRTPEFAGKSGLKSLWVALTNPWNLGNIRPESPVDIYLVSLWPILLILAGRLVFSSFLSAAYILLVFLLLVPFYLFLLAVNRGQTRFHIWAAISGPMLLMNLLPLGMVGIRGPLYYWYQFWMGPEIRTLYVSMAVVISVWFLLVLYQAQRTAYQKSRAVAIGNLLLAIGSSLAILGAFISFVGLEEGITAINDQMAVLPLGLSRILGITTHLDIPLVLPNYLLIFGVILGFVSACLSWLRIPLRRRVSGS